MLYIFFVVLFCCSSCIFNINFFSPYSRFLVKLLRPKTNSDTADITSERMFLMFTPKKKPQRRVWTTFNFSSLARRVFSRVSLMAVVGERRRRTWNVRSVGNGRDSFAQFSTSLLFIFFSFMNNNKKNLPTLFVWTLSARMRKSLTLHDTGAILRLDWQVGTITRHRNVPEKSRNSREISRKSTFFSLATSSSPPSIWFLLFCMLGRAQHRILYEKNSYYFALFWGSRQNKISNRIGWIQL